MPLERKRPVIDFSLGQVTGIALAPFSLTPEVVSSYTTQSKKAFQSIQSLWSTLYPEVREIPRKPLCPHVISNSCTENKKIGGTGLEVPLKELLFTLRGG
jgi:hypothetical protein